MTNRNDVIIYMRYISLDVVIPEKYVWEFMREFGETFAVKDSDGVKNLKAVDGYYDHPAGWHIQVTVFENDEGKFYDFLRTFCSKRKLSFREP
jgi:hypothetical protein